jgi:uncharacterized protein
MVKTSVTLSALWIYPLKSARGIRVNQAELTPMGLKHDRRWMLIDDQGRFLSQRELPAMAQLIITLTPQGFTCHFQDHQCDIPLLQQAPATRIVNIWRSEVSAWVYPTAINQWFSERLQKSCALVYMPESTYRDTNPLYAPGQRVSFADGYPYLLANAASLNTLNQHLRDADQPAVTMEHFRPNLVLEGDQPHGEYHWKSLHLQDFVFEVVKPCERCVIVNNDPLSGERNKEPLRTMSQHNRFQNAIIFGQNACSPNSTGTLSVGLKGHIYAS